MTTIRAVPFALALISAAVDAHGQEQPGRGEPPYTVTRIFEQAMSDPGLAGYGMLVTRLDIIPGGVDPAPHRHDADLFVYVLAGSIEVELDGQKATYNTGTMFHEPRNVLHSLLRNTSEQEPASILAVFVIKSGRDALVPATE